VKLFQLISQNGEDSEIYCTCLVAAKDEPELAKTRKNCGGNVDNCLTNEVSSVNDEDGLRYKIGLKKAKSYYTVEL
jgi:hypothetical protein